MATSANKARLAPAPRRLTVDALLADAYREASLAGAPMRTCVDALERVRSAGRCEPIDRWRLIERLIGSTTNRRLRAVLVEFRDRVVALEQKDQCAALRKRLRTSSQRAWGTWLETFARAVATFRLDYALMLCEALPQRATKPPFSRAELLTQTRNAVHGRWAEALPLYERLASTRQIPAHERALFYAFAAQIQIYQLADPKAAEAFFRRARRLAPEDAEVISTEGDLQYQAGRTDAAVAAYKRALEKDHTSVSAATGIARMQEAAGDLSEAELTYLDAIAREPGAADPRTALIRLYGRPELFEERRRRIPQLVRDVAEVSSSSEYEAMVEAGTAYAANGAMNTACTWFRRAIAKDREGPDALVARGYASADAGNVERAIRDFRTVLEIAPTSVKGPSGLAYAYTQASQYEEALNWHARVLELRPTWTARVASERSEIFVRLGRLDDAGAEFDRALEAGRHDAAIVAQLGELAETVYATGERACAQRMFQRLRARADRSYRPTYWNTEGNCAFAQSDYAAARDAYRRAVAGSPTDPVFRRNLAGALRGLGKFDDALAEYERAVALDHDEQADHAARSLVYNDQGNQHYASQRWELAARCYERAHELQPDDPMYITNQVQALLAQWPVGERAAVLSHALALLADIGEAELSSAIRFELQLIEHFGEPPADADRSRIAVLRLVLDDDLVDAVVVPQTTELAATTQRLLAELRARFSERFGVELPGVRFRRRKELNSAGHYDIQVLEHAACSGEVIPGCRFAPTGYAALKRAGINFAPGHAPGRRSHGAWVPAAEWERAAEAGVELWQIAEYPLRHLEHELESVVRSKERRAEPAPEAVV